jgi:hypothetical protein
MPVQNQLPLRDSNQESADSACGHCDGVNCHEAWCVTQNDSVQYAFQAVSDPSHLSLGDRLILHALGAAWTAKRTLPKPSGFRVWLDRE